MRLVYAGTPEFAVAPLNALLDAGHEIALVLTQPDRPAGRGLKLAPSPVKAAALGRGLEVATPSTLRDPQEQARLRGVGAKAMVVAAYGLILPQAVLDIPPLGCINIHASLLPRWRGAAPVQRAILAGDLETGVTIMLMDAGLDTGPMLLVRRIPIDDADTAGTLTDKLSVLGAEAIVQAMAEIERGGVQMMPQPGDGATYAAKVVRGEEEIDWSRSAAEIARQVRAFNPSPGASTVLGGERLKIWKAAPVEGRDSPGSVLAAGRGELRVACGEGALQVLSLQRAGGKRLAAREFLAGTPLASGTRLGA